MAHHSATYSAVLDLRRCVGVEAIEDVMRNQRDCSDEQSDSAAATIHSLPIFTDEIRYSKTKQI